MNTTTAGASPVSTASVLSSLAVAPPEVEASVRQANSLYAQATAITIDSPAMYQMAADELNDLRTRFREIENTRKHLKEPFLEGGRRIDAFFKVPLDRLSAAADEVKTRMGTYKAEQDRIAEEARRAEEARLRSEREELERQQREAEAAARAAREEAERAERAARAKAEAEAAAARAAGDEAAARAAEEQAAREAEEARQRAQAAEIEQARRAAEAQAAIDLAEIAPPPAVTSAATAAGVATRKTWKVKSVDLSALVQAAAEGITRGDESLLAYLIVDESALNGVARALKGAARVPGVVFGEETSIAATGGRRR